MNPGGVVLMVFGALGIAQLFWGNALERLKILPSTAGQTPATSTPTVAPPGVTVAPTPQTAPHSTGPTPTVSPSPAVPYGGP